MSGPTHRLADGTCVFPEGHDPADLTPLTEADQLAAKHEAALRDLRADRSALLAACDWTQLPDTPLSEADRTAWCDYRQALRDLPETVDPLDFEWPVSPSP